MAKMTKTQYRRAYHAILQKASSVWRKTQKMDSKYVMSTTDFLAIEKICDKYLKKF